MNNLLSNFKKVAQQDIFINLLRQGIGAGLFLGATIYLSQSMTTNAFADYLLSWSSGQLIFAICNLGLYNLVIRLLKRTESKVGRGVYFNVLSIVVLQLLLIPIVAAIFNNYLKFNIYSCMMFSYALAAGNFATALLLGSTSVRIFSYGEFLQSVMFLIGLFVFHVSTDLQVSLIAISSAFLKLLYSVYFLKNFRNINSTHESSVNAAPIQSSGGVYAMQAYLQSILSAAESRLSPFLFSIVFGESGFNKIAPLWMMLDRMMAVIQGINQINYPKIVANSISNRRITLDSVIALSLLLLSSIGCALFYIFFKNSGFELVYLVFVLLFFMSQGAWQLLLNYLLAKERFTILFLAHGLVLASFLTAYAWTRVSANFYGSLFLISAYLSGTVFVFLCYRLNIYKKRLYK